jgi:hypothetical protein
MKRNLSKLALVIRLVEASPMRPDFLQSVLVYILSAVSLPFVVACWLAATLAKATVRQISLFSTNLSRRTSPRTLPVGAVRVNIPGFRLRGFGNGELVRQHVTALVDDWLCANGWKYRLVGVWLPDPKTVSPFGAVMEWWKVYQIALEDPKGMVEFGWLRFGDGKVEFRFDVEELHQSLRIDPNEAHTRANVFPPEPMEVGVGADPLWDRSLDG